MTNPKDLINWKALSRYLAGNDTSVSRTRIPKKYQGKVDELIEMIEGWQFGENKEGVKEIINKEIGKI